MSKLKSLYDVLGKDDQNTELYVTDQRARSKRSQKGQFSRTQGLFNFLQLIKDWEMIVGKLMAKNTIPLKIKGTTLIISTKHAIFAQELGFLVPIIIEKINSTFPDLNKELTNIKFVHSNFSSEQFTSDSRDEHPSTIVRKKLHPFSPEYIHKKSKAEEMFKGIEDPEIKQMLTDFLLS